MKEIFTLKESVTGITNAKNVFDNTKTYIR